MNKSFQVKEFQVTVYNTQNQDCPVIYTNTLDGEGDLLFQACEEDHLSDYVLVTVSNLNWCTDLAPWYCPPIGPTDIAWYPGADAYLDTFIHEIVPRSEELLSFRPTNRILAGYSMAGLFAVYSLYQTSLFDEVVSGSGSFWFPDFIQYVRQTPMCIRPRKMYFSLGEQEAFSDYPVLQSIEERTEWLYHWYEIMGIPTRYVLEEGNHFNNQAQRMERGIAWALEAELKKEQETTKKEGDRPHF